ncbi:MAG: hypothetical protein IJ317_02115 [Clostridia bacterium]|nr:hypothetical protein [Clostridia bacterium]
MFEEENIDYKNPDEVVELIRELVVDETMQKILFAVPTRVPFNKNALRRNATDYMRNIISMAFTLIYTRWKQIYDNDANMTEERLRKFRNSRYSVIFSSVKDYEEITLDIMVFAIIEVWVGTHVDDDTKRLFDRFFSVDKECIGVLLQNALNYASEEEELGEKILDAEEGNRMICDLLEALEIFSRVHFLESREDFFEFYYKISGTRKVILQPNKSFGEPKFICHDGYFEYMSGTAEEEKEKPIIRPYIRFSASEFLGETKYLYRTFDENSYGEVCMQKHDVLENELEKDQVEAMRQFLAFNYNRLRDFALVISDTIGEMPGYKRTIYDLFSKRFEQIFPDRSVLDDEHSWDNIITLLLVELGLSEFLQEFIDENFFERVMANINRRYLRGVVYDGIMSEYRASLAKIEEKCRLQKHFRRANSRRLMVKTIFTAISARELDAPASVDYSMYEESLATKYDKAKLLIEKLTVKPSSGLDATTLELNRRELEKTLKDVLSFVQIYYAGVSGYARHYNQADFVKEGREKYLKIKDMSLSQLYESFLAQCCEYNPDATDKGYYSLAEKAKLLKKVITRTYICDVQKLKYYVAIQNDKGVDTNIFEFVENLGRYAYLEEYNTWLGYILDFFIFLVYNDDCTNRGLVDSFESGEISEKEIDPIYPYIVCYYSQNIDRDRIKRCDYKAYIPAKYSTEGIEDGKVAKDSITVTLLTEKEYDIDSNYYCMPLKYGATGSWWIDPLMIPTKVFAEILKGEKI